MSLIVKQITERKDLREFVDFPNRLYKGNRCYVPALRSDELATFDPAQNPAFELAEAAFFLALRDGKTVGRIAAIINRVANEKWNKKEVRFGWYDYVDDREVAKALLDEAAAFGKARGMERMTGPQGFFDFDPEGLLVEGFEHLSSFICRYNYPYYAVHLEELGYTKVVDWVEYKIAVPTEVPERIAQLDKAVREKYGYRVRTMSKKEAIQGGMGRKAFHLVNETYGDLYNYVEMTDRMIDHFVATFLAIMDLSYSCIVEDRDGEIVGFAFSMPSIVRAMQKSKGRLFPFGWWHLLKSLYWKHEENLELLLIGIKPEKENSGILAIMFNFLIPIFAKGGFKYAESNAELEYNVKVRAPWTNFNSIQHKRRRIYGKDI